MPINQWCQRALKEQLEEQDGSGREMTAVRACILTHCDVGPLHFLNFHAFGSEMGAVIPALQVLEWVRQGVGVKDTVNSEDLPLWLISRKDEMSLPSYR